MITTYHSMSLRAWKVQVPWDRLLNMMVELIPEDTSIHQFLTLWVAELEETQIYSEMSGKDIIDSMEILNEKLFPVSWTLKTGNKLKDFFQELWKGLKSQNLLQFASTMDQVDTVMAHTSTSSMIATGTVSDASASSFLFGNEMANNIPPVKAAPFTLTPCSSITRKIPGGSSTLRLE